MLFWSVDLGSLKLTLTNSSSATVACLVSLGVTRQPNYQCHENTTWQMMKYIGDGYCGDYDWGSGSAKQQHRLGTKIWSASSRLQGSSKGSVEGNASAGPRRDKGGRELRQQRQALT